MPNIVLSVCGVLAQKCANQNISYDSKKKKWILYIDWVARRHNKNGSNTLLMELRMVLSIKFLKLNEN